MVTKELKKSLFADWLGVCNLMVIAHQMCYFVITLMLLMELIQVYVNVFLICYIIPLFLLLVFWVVTHSYFFGRYGVNKNHVTSSELAKATAIQLCTAYILACVSLQSTIFLSRKPTPPGIGDSHIVQNGMDTKSGIFTLWIIMIATINMGSFFIVSQSVFLPDLYFYSAKKCSEKNNTHDE